MIFTKDLLLKGLAGLALCTGTAALGVHYMGGFSSLFGEVNITRVEDIGLTTSNECKLPEAGTITCNLTAENINNVKFEGKNSTATSLTGTGTLQATLQISIPQGDEKVDFPHGYKFTLSVPSTSTGTVLTINRNDVSGGNIVLKTGESLDFKIIQKENNKFSLEKAWTKDLLAKKVGLEKTGDHWTIGSKAVKVKHDNSPESKTASPAQPGKIKAYVDTSYNQGFKFVIEDGDIALTSGADGGNTITKLEELETYEIKNESEGWVLVRKSKAFDEVKKAIGLPAECTMSESNEVECALGSEEKLKAVNFDSKTGDATVSDSTYSNIKLKISKTTEANKDRFPHGFKFILVSDKEITAISIKANTNTEFKIKKTVTNGNTALTLEKAWTVADLAKKVGLTECTSTTTKQCDFVENSINVYEGESSFVKGASLATGNTDKKMTYEDGVQGYNQGFKFYVPHSETDNISITGGTGAANGTTVSTISKETTSGGTPTYQIKEEGGTWYLVKKT